MLSSTEIKQRFSESTHNYGMYSAYANVLLPTLIVFLLLSTIGSIAFGIGNMFLFVKDIIILVAAITGDILIRRLDLLGQMYNVVFMVLTTVSAVSYNIWILATLNIPKLISRPSGGSDVGTIIGNMSTGIIEASFYLIIILTIATAAIGSALTIWLVRCTDVFYARNDED